MKFKIVYTIEILYVNLLNALDNLKFYNIWRDVNFIYKCIYINTKKTYKQ